MPGKMIKLLLERADMDLGAALRLLRMRRSYAADEPIGLLAQQAVEKYSRAILIRYQVKMGSEHDLALMFESLRQVGHPVPAHLYDLTDLTKFGLRVRYDTLNRLNLPPINRVWLTNGLRNFSDWAKSQVSGGK